MEFRDANNLKEVLLRYPVPYQPGHLLLSASVQVNVTVFGY